MQFVVFLQPFGHFKPRNLRKLDVHKDQVRPMFTCKIKGFHTISGLNGRVPGCLDQVTKELHVQLIVFNNHNLFGHFDPLICGSGLHGRRIAISCGAVGLIAPEA